MLPDVDVVFFPDWALPNSVPKPVRAGDPHVHVSPSRLMVRV